MGLLGSSPIRMSHSFDQNGHPPAIALFQMTAVAKTALCDLVASIAVLSMRVRVGTRRGWLTSRACWPLGFPVFLLAPRPCACVEIPDGVFWRDASLIADQSQAFG